MNYRELGIISIVMTWVGLVFLIRRWPGDRTMSFSAHAASGSRATVFYGSLFTITLPLFYLFMSKWFVPTFSLPSIFLWLLAIGCTCQIIAAWTPSITPTKTRVHNITAYAMHSLLLALLTMLLLYGGLSNFARSFASVALVVMLAIWLTFVFVKTMRKHTLYLQTVYAITFHTAILTFTYAR